MTNPDLEQIELLARVDGLVERLAKWADGDVPWEPARRSRAIVRRTLDRVHELRIRLETPLVVGTFGGTGTGKSSLVNALVGTEVTRTGRQRPTTTRPVMIVHEATDPGRLGLPLEEFEIVRTDAALLRDVVILDCPDPDTSESEAAGGNLAFLRSVVPHCDVLLYASTQQKYRNARVVEEFGDAAKGRRLLFVQTRADEDEDVREDWRRRLAEHFAVPQVFFVDSLRALAEQREGRRPSGDFGRLMDVITRELAASERVRIRRANILDLLHDVLDRCQALLDERFDDVQALETALEEQRARLTGTMTKRLGEELAGGRNLWERRLVSAVADNWGTSPFSSVLRIYNGLGGLLASMSLFRARSSAQLAILGAVQGTRWLRTREQERTTEGRLERLGSLGLDDATLREERTVTTGYVNAAEIDPDVLDVASLDELRNRAIRAEGEILGNAGRRIDEIIQEVAKRNSGWFVRGWYELLFLTFVGFLLYRMGRNFFYDSFVRGEELLPSEFYVSAGLFFLLWTALLVIAFTRRLRRGLDKRIENMAETLSRSRLASGPFPQLDRVCETIRRTRESLAAMRAEAESLREFVADGNGLGSRLARRGEPVRVPEAVASTR